MHPNEFLPLPHNVEENQLPFLSFQAKWDISEQDKGLLSCPTGRSKMRVQAGPRAQLTLLFTLVHSMEPQHLFTEKGFSYCQRDAERVGNGSPWKVLQGPPVPNGKYLHGEDIVHGSKTRATFHSSIWYRQLTSGKYAVCLKQRLSWKPWQ